MILLRILLRILIEFYKDFTTFYGVLKKMVQKNQYTYNVPPGSSNYIYTRGRRPSLMGRMGRVGRVDGPEKCPLNFFILCG